MTLLLLSLLVLLCLTHNGSNAKQLFKIVKSDGPYYTVEGGRAAYSLSLLSPPNSDVVINLESKDEFSSLSASQLVFSSQNWNEPQYLIVEGVPDHVIRLSPYASTISLSTLTDDVDFASFDSTQGQAPLNFSILLQDSDQAGAAIHRMMDFPYPESIPEGRFANYHVTLQTKPLADVTISLSTPSTLSAMPSTFTFTPENWNVPQKLHLTAVQDDVVRASPYDAHVQFGFTSSDGNYSALTQPDALVAVEDLSVETTLRHAAVTWFITRVSSRSHTTSVMFRIEISVSNTAVTFPSSPVVGTVFNLETQFSFGDGAKISLTTFTASFVSPTYVTGFVEVSHDYTQMDQLSTWGFYEVSLTQCCRQSSFASSASTFRRLRFEVNSASLAISPKFPSLPTVRVPSDTFVEFYVPFVSDVNTVRWTLASPPDLGDGLVSVPQGLEVDRNVGAVYWDTTDVPIGEYPVGLVAQDLQTHMNSTMEFIISVYTPSGNGIPVFEDANPFNTYYFQTEKVTTYSLHATPADGSIVSISPVSSLPAGATLNSDHVFTWVPTASQLGSYPVCFIATESDGDVSLPYCINFVVTTQMRATAPIFNVTGPSTCSETVASFVVNNDSWVILSPEALLFSANSTIQKLTVGIINTLDGDYESIGISQGFSLGSLTLIRYSNSLIDIKGTASASTYQNILRHLVYQNAAHRPHVGSRAVYYRVTSTTSLVSSQFVQVDVTLNNMAPQLSFVEQGKLPYWNYSVTYIPQGPSVTLFPSHTSFTVQDSDSLISSATITINGIENPGNEDFEIAFVPDPSLTAPSTQSVADLFEQFGSNAPRISNTLSFADESSSTVSRVTVVVSLFHSWIGDLILELEHDGRVETLALAPGGGDCSADDMIGTVFDDEGIPLDTTICRYQLRGTFKPVGKLSNFAGSSLNGDWTLHITDQFPETDDGVFLGWSILVDRSPPHLSYSFASLQPVQINSNSHQAISSIFIQDDGAVSSFRIQANLVASSLQDVTISLRSPDGTKMDLVSSASCSPVELSALVFDANVTESLSETSTDACVSGSSIGVFKPIDGCFEHFLEVGIRGEWVLELQSTTDSQAHVSLTYWRIEIVTQPNIQSTFDSGVLSLQGLDSAANYASTISTLLYINGNGSPSFNSPRQVSFQLTDEHQAQSNVISTFVTIHHIILIMNTYEADETWDLTSSIQFIEQGIPALIADSSLVLRDPVFESSSGYQLVVQLSGPGFDVSTETILFPESEVVSVTSESSPSQVVYTLTSSAATPISAFYDVLKQAKYSNSIESVIDDFRFISIKMSDSGIYFSHEVTVQVNVTRINHAPIISEGASLDGIVEDSFENTGTLVSTLLRSSFYDVDSLVPRAPGVEFFVGIAVIGVDRRNGDWQYRCDDGSTFRPFVGAVLEDGFVYPKDPNPEKATLLSSHCLIRFVPTIHFNTERDLTGRFRPASDVPTLRFKAWDGSDHFIHSVGQITVNTSKPFVYTQSFSEHSALMSIQVNATDNAPAINLGGFAGDFANTFIENSGPAAIVGQSSLSIQDVDNSTLASVTITITNVFDSTNESIILLLADTNLTSSVVSEDTISVTDGIETLLATSTVDSTAKTFTLVIHSADETPVDGIFGSTISFYQLVLQRLAYSNTEAKPSNSTRIITFQVNDGIEVSSVRTSVIMVRNIQEFAPALILSEYSFTYTEDQTTPLLIVNPQFLQLSDADNDNKHQYFIEYASVSLSNADSPSSDVLAVTIPSGLLSPITSQYNSASGELRIVGPASVSDFMKVLRTVTFFNSQDEPSGDVQNINFFVVDGGGQKSNVETASVAMTLVNDHAAKISYSQAYTFTEGDAPLNLGSGIALSDLDTGDFPVSSVTITLSGYHYLSDQENLTVFSSPTTLSLGTGIVALVDNNHVADKVSAQWDVSARVLTLTGPAPLSDFQHVVSTLTFNLVGKDPRSNSRTLAVSLNDGAFTTEKSVDITVVPIDNPPIMTIDDPSVPVEYVEGNSPSNLFSGRIHISDYDDVNLQSARINLSDINKGDEKLVILGTVPNTISVTNTDTSITFVGDASIQSYIDALSSVAYVHTSGRPTPGRRNITVDVADDLSNCGILTIQTNVTESAVPTSIFLYRQTKSFTNTFIEDANAVFIAGRDSEFFDVDSDYLTSLTAFIVNPLDLQNETVGLGNTALSSISPALHVSGRTEFCQEFCNVRSEHFFDDPATQAEQTADCLITCSTLVPEAPSSTFIHIIGKATKAVYNTVLQALTYIDTTDEPNYTNRTLSILVSDDTFLFSNASFTTIVMVAVNEAPILRVSAQAIDSYNATFTERGQPIPVVDQSVSVLTTDVDDTLGAEFEVVLTSFESDQYEGIFNLLDTASNGALSHPTEFDLLANSKFGPLPGADRLVLGKRIYINQTKTLDEFNTILHSIRYVNLNRNASTSVARTVTFRIRDPQGLWSPTRSTNIKIAVLNDAPIVKTSLATSAQSIDEDHVAASFDALAAFFDPEERPNLDNAEVKNFTVRVYGAPEFGTVNITGNMVTFSPAQNDYGARPFSYVVCDSLGDCSDPWNVTVSIAAVNDPPYSAGVPLVHTMKQDTTARISLDPYYYDVEDYHREPFQSAIDGSSLLTVKFPTNQPDLTGVGRLSLKSGHIMEFVPRDLYVGNSSVLFFVCDSQQLCSNFTLTVIVELVNKFPVIPAAMSGSVLENTMYTLPLTISDLEDDGCPASEANARFCLPLQVAVNVTAHNGTASLSWAPNAANGAWTLFYTPNQYFSGDDWFVLEVCDSLSACVLSNFSMTVTPVNNAPLIAEVTLHTFENVILVKNLLDIAHDVEEVLRGNQVSISTDPVHGTYTYDSDTGLFTYTPNQYFFGSDSFTLQACDSDNLCSSRPIPITIEFVNQLPTAPEIPVSVYENFNVTFQVAGLGSDVEDMTVMAGKVILTMLPIHGVATYNNVAGTATYVPEQFYHGNDTIVYRSCDSLNNCSHGFIRISVLPVNHAPRLKASANTTLPYKVEEDTFNLIFILLLHEDPDIASSADSLSQNVKDVESGLVPPLRITLTSTTQHGTLFTYSKYGIVAYKPNDNFVGNDSFSYKVCDVCSNFRNAELGRLGASKDPACVREVEISPAGTEYGCLDVIVPIQINNVNDVPVASNLSGAAAVVDNKPVSVSVYPFKYAFDEDNVQRDSLLTVGASLSVHLLNLREDLDFQSLAIVTQPQNGTASVASDIGAFGTSLYQSLVYKPQPGFYGTDSFDYLLCDLQATCARATVFVAIGSQGPVISAITALPACTASGDPEEIPLDRLSCDGLIHVDAKFGTGDRIHIQFDSPTNMPPFNTAGRLILRPDIDKMFNFSQPLLRNRPPEIGYHGTWINATSFILLVTDPGYPERSVAPMTFSVSVIGSTAYKCLAFETATDLYTPVPEDKRNAYCLRNSNLTSFHQSSQFTGMMGNWGFRLGTMSGMVMQNPDGVEASYFGPGSAIQVQIEPPLTLDQMYNHCKKPASEVFNMNMFGTGAEAMMDCNNIDANGNELPTDLTPEQYGCLYNKDSLNATTLAQCTEIIAPLGLGDLGSRRRRDANGTTTTSTSGFNLMFTSLNSNLNPLSAGSFLDAISASWNLAALAATILSNAGIAGVDVGMLLSYTMDTPGAIKPLDPSKSLLMKGSDKLTPMLVAVNISGSVPGLTIGDTLLLTFSGDTNAPSLDPATNMLTRAQVDYIVWFDPPIGTNATDAYVGQWTSLNTLLITINKPTTNKNVVDNPNVIDIKFQPVRLFNGGNSTDPCLGASVCGAVGDSWGICNTIGTSCRANGVFHGQDFTGSFGSVDASKGAAFNNLYIILILGGVLLIICCFLVYYYQKKRSEKKEVSRVLRAWRAKFQPQEDKQDKPFPTTGEVWARPPAMVSMRTAPDPFQSMSEQSGTQMAEKPIQKQDTLSSRPFVPRAGATIDPSDPFASSSLPPLASPMFPSQAAPPPTSALPPLKGLNRDLWKNTAARLPTVASGGPLPPLPQGTLPPVRKLSTGVLPGPADASGVPPPIGLPGIARRASTNPFGVPAFALPPTRLPGDPSAPAGPPRRVDPFAPRRPSADMPGGDGAPPARRDPFARPSLSALNPPNMQSATSGSSFVTSGTTSAPAPVAPLSLPGQRRLSMPKRPSLASVRVGPAPEGDASVASPPAHADGSRKSGSETSLTGSDDVVSSQTS